MPILAFAGLKKKKSILKILLIINFQKKKSRKDASFKDYKLNNKMLKYSTVYLYNTEISSYLLVNIKYSSV